MTTYETTAKKHGQYLIRIKKKVNNASPTMTALHKVLQFVGAIDDPAVREPYDSLIGRTCPPEGFLSSNIIESERLGLGLAAAMQRHIFDNPGLVAVKTRHLGTSPGSKPIVDVPAIRKMMNTKDVDTISAIDLYAVPEPNDPSGFGIAIDVRTVQFGPNVQYGRISRPYNRRCQDFPYAGSVSGDIPEYMDETALRDAFKRLVEPRWTVPIAEEREDSRCYPTNWNEGRAFRAFVMLQIWSMLPIDKRLFASGTGKPILDAELGFAKDRLSTARKGSANPIHRDGIPHFWFGEVHRLNVMGSSVPQVKLR